MSRAMRVKLHDFDRKVESWQILVWDNTTSLANLNSVQSRQSIIRPKNPPKNPRILTHSGNIVQRRETRLLVIVGYDFPSNSVLQAIFIK